MTSSLYDWKVLKQTAVRVTATVQLGGRVEIADPQLPTGKSVDVLVLFPQEAEASRRSVVDVLAEAPGQLVFHNAEEVDAYIREERDAWDR